MLQLYHTYKRKLLEFKPIKGKKVALYTCGPTVYLFAHIGNMRYFLFEDVLHRSLAFLGYKVKHVMNITDVGHLTSDEDEGEDKIEKGAKIMGKTVWEVAEFYTRAFLNDAKALNILNPDILSKATDNVPEIIDTVEKLVEKGYGYETKQAIYFDVAKFTDYENLTGQRLEEKIRGAREEVITDPEKRNPADFALWFKTVGRFQNHVMRWPSPWGEGFPGWHIECSVISAKFLGQPFDIHTGGVDHITVPHANEIAQSTAAYDRPLANFWLHSEFLLVDGQKMSKSLNNLYTLADLAGKGYSPLDFRYLNLTTHYRQKLNFTWQGLHAAHQAYRNLKSQIREYDKSGRPDKKYMEQFSAALEDDLNTPKALAVLWELVKNNEIKSETKRATINSMDEVLGLGLKGLKAQPIPNEIKKLVKERDEAREQKEWARGDQIRKQIQELGYVLEDTPEGTIVRLKA